MTTDSDVPMRREPIELPLCVMAGAFSGTPLAGAMTAQAPHRVVALGAWEAPMHARRYEHEVWPAGKPSARLRAELVELENSRVVPAALSARVAVMIRELLGMEDGDGYGACMARKDFTQQIDLGRNTIDAARKELPLRPGPGSQQPERAKKRGGRRRDPGCRRERVARFLARADRPYTVDEVRACLSAEPHSIALKNWHSAVAWARKTYPSEIGTVSDPDGVVVWGPRHLIDRIHPGRDGSSAGA